MRRNPEVLWRGLGGVALAAAVACGNENEPPPGGSLAVARASASGDGQSAVVATALANPIAVVVTRDGAAEAGVSVGWSVVSGGGTLGGASSTTDAQGIASTTWTLGQAAGAQGARATVAGATGSPVSFTATATPGAAATLAASGGSGQSAEVGTALANPIEARVTDQFGNGVPGVSVAWAVTGGGGSVAPLTSATDASGEAATTWTLGATVGPQAATATVAALAGSPVAFAATGTAPPAPGSGVTVSNNAFTPATRTVAAGTTVTWTWQNTGAISHNVESTGSPSFTSSPVLMGNGSTYSFEFTTPGTYTYECIVHGSAMSGTIIVQ